MKEAKHFWIDNGSGPSNSLLPDSYYDPVAHNAHRYQYLAAFAPVLVRGRPHTQGDTGWFVIVEQRRDLTGTPPQTAQQ